MTPNLPRRLGRYQVTGLIGVGAFASVFRARDERLDADVAIKVLAENHSFDADLRERFITEGHLLRRMDSPHVVTVFDLGETDSGQPFLVLELAHGGDLRSRRRTLGDGGADGDTVLLVADQVARALAALHAEQVVHRDVSPGNLLVQGSRRSSEVVPTALIGPDERLLLADLGLSKDMALASGLTVGAGTAGFTPPEQGAGGWVDVRADIWSASALMVWLGLGREPDGDGRWVEQLLRRGWPADLLTELGRGLSIDLEERHASAEAWVESLRSAVHPPRPPVDAGTDDQRGRTLSSEVGDGGRGADPEPRGGPANDDAPGGNRRRWPTVLAAVLATVLLVGGGWWMGRHDPSRSVRTEQLDGDRTRATASEGAVQVVIVGPDQVTVGTAATYDAEVTGADHFVWLAPDGVAYPDRPQLTVRPTSSGVTNVQLTARGSDGSAITSELDIRVREES